MSSKKTGRASPSSLSSSSAASATEAGMNQLCYMVVVDRDPSQSNYVLLFVEDLKDQDWKDKVLANLSTCGVCLVAPSTSVKYAVSKSGAGLMSVFGFVSCADKRCRAIAQLRSDNRLGCGQAMCRARVFTTAESITKCCVLCAKFREAGPTFLCGRCRAVRYCNKRCQVAHWPLHKNICVANATAPPVPEDTL